MLIFLHRCYRVLLYLAVATVLLSAITIALIRLVLPQADHYRDEIQTLVSRYIQHPVTISKISVDLDGWIATIDLQQLAIFSAVTDTPIATVDSVVAEIDILRSLYNNEVIFSSIVGSTLALNLIKKTHDDTNILKALTAQLGGNKLNNNKLVAWALKQDYIAIEKMQITMAPEAINDATSWPFVVTAFNVKHNNGTNEVVGHLNFPTHSDNTLYFRINIEHNSLTPRYSGELYVEGKAIPIAMLLNQINVADITASHGVGDVTLKGSWDSTKLNELDGQLSIDDLTLQRGDSSTVYIDELAGGFKIVNNADQTMVFSFDLEKFVGVDNTWPQSTFVLKKTYVAQQNDYQYQLSADYINLLDSYAFLALVAPLSEQLTVIKTLSPSGELTNFSMQFDPTLANNEQFYIETEFSKLQLKATEHEINADGLSGYIKGSQETGKVGINATDTTFELTDLFAQPFAFNQLGGELDWQFADERLSISSQLLNVVGADFDLSLTGELQFSPDSTLPFVDLSMQLSNFELNQLDNFLPIRTPKKLKKWLKNALVSGKVSTADFILQGYLKDFPFYNNEGTFKVSADIQQGTLAYSQKWPPIKKIDARLGIKDNTLTINADAGNIFSAKLIKASAVINNIIQTGKAKYSVLTDFHISGQLEDGLQFIKNSPLIKNAALETLLSKNIAGGLELDLDLNIPLPKKPLSINGALAVTDGTIDIKELNSALTELDGVINFTQTSVAAKNIKATLFDYPVNISFATNREQPTKITLSGYADNQFIGYQLSHYLPMLQPFQTEIEAHISGQTLWELTSINSDASTDNQLTIRSSLKELMIDLPAPLQKTESTQSLPIEISIKNAEQDKKTIAIQYADLLHGVIDMTGNKPTRPMTIWQSLNNGIDHKNGKPKITITAYMKYLAIDEWISFISNSTSNNSVQSDIWSTLNIHVKQLTFANQHFEDVLIELNNIGSDYHLSLSSKAIQGNIYISQKLDSAIKIQLQTLHLNKHQHSDYNKQANQQIEPQQIPEFEIDIAEFIYNDMKLGHLSLVGKKVDNKFIFDEIKLNKKDVLISGKGTWETINDQQKTTFDLKLEAESMATILETLNHERDTLLSKEVKLDLNASWPGNPTHFSLNTIVGKLNIHLKNVQLDKIDPSVGRLFGLLSLQVLPQRLTMDFSDIFNKGTTFHNINGSFDIENGQAYTSDSTLSGPSMDIYIDGRVGLIAQDYEQQVTVIPKISDSLPLVSTAIFSATGIGISIYLVNKLFSTVPKKVNSLLSKHYKMTGTWDQPQITRIKPQP